MQSGRGVRGVLQHHAQAETEPSVPSRLGCGVPPCSPMPRSPEECRRLRTCSECLARHPRTLQPGDGEVSGGMPRIPGTMELVVCDWLGGENCARRGAPHRACALRPAPRRPLPAVSGAPIAQRGPASGATAPARQRTTVGSTSARSSGPGTARRPRVGPLTVSSAHARASACGHGSSRGRVSLCGPGRAGCEGGSLRLLTSPGPTPGETRRILSVQPTYDWTCFSHSLLNVSPMPVESSPPLPCPTPCHLLPNCTSCLASKGADGGWQHCVWSSSLQQVMPTPSAQPWHPLSSIPASAHHPSSSPCHLSFPHFECLLLL